MAKGEIGVHQPRGLADSSRWLKRSENHRNKSEKSCTPKGYENLKENLLRTLLIWHPIGVRSFLPLNRWSALRYDHRLLSRNPLGCMVAPQTWIRFHKISNDKCL